MATVHLLQEDSHKHRVVFLLATKAKIYTAPIGPLLMAATPRRLISRHGYEGGKGQKGNGACTMCAKDREERECRVPTQCLFSACGNMMLQDDTKLGEITWDSDGVTVQQSGG